MTPVTPSHRGLRTQILAGGLLFGSLCLISLPWLLSGFSPSQDPSTDQSAIPLPSKLPSKLYPPFSLPEKNLQGRDALEQDLALLTEGLRRLQQTADFSGTFRKQERIDGILDDGSLIEIKGRHQPLSLYMKWLEGDRGRELLFVEGENDGEMLVRLGGIRGRLLPALKLNPNGETARQEARHHISHVSILNLTKQVIEYCRRDLDRSSGVNSQLIVQGENDGGSIRVMNHYDSPEAGGEYRKTIHVIDRATLLPLQIKTYCWPEDGQEIPADQWDEQTLLEDYEYSNLRFDLPLTDTDFSTKNPTYRFIRHR